MLQAHPNSWLDLKTHIEGQESMITGFEMEWTFDDPERQGNMNFFHNEFEVIPLLFKSRTKL
ncbi:DUF1007 family protein [Vibrio sp. Isolate25]|uniref:DUF1007 family protein n=1 Tax=Vibrio sp. Isolate25 TaxID=2908535 RepID=UPI001EFED9F2|nr:DUF1007 family protein [Vibrio sp. Isolate25]MCG9596266.1 DUF1007 family protein [Vibrio sp. Isolate25]